MFWYSAPVSSDPRVRRAGFTDAASWRGKMPADATREPTRTASCNDDQLAAFITWLGRTSPFVADNWFCGR